MSRRLETAKVARIKSWRVRAMPEDYLQISFPARLPAYAIIRSGV